MYPLDYIDPVFRPPSEARSLILQVTNGCSWNRCSFCEMYTEPQKRFSTQSLEQLEQQVSRLALAGYPVRRVFLADGDAMTLSMRRLTDILQMIRNYYPTVQRVSAYCLPRNLKNKSVEDLQKLRELGLSLLYVGCESGDDEVLACVEKGETFASSLTALEKIHAAGMQSSVMILNGLGGVELSAQHALNSARLMNAAQPHFLSVLVVTFPSGMERHASGFEGRFRPLSQHQSVEELHALLQSLELSKTIFRSDHASNYLVLKGVLGRDKETLLQQVELALQRPDLVPLREEWQRSF